VRLKRNQQQKLIGELVKKSAIERQQSLEKMGLDAVEQLIFQTILRYGLNPLSVCKNHFPMLKLPEDVKRAIRERGLGDAQAKVIGKLSAEKLNVSPKKVEQIRQQLIDEVLTEHLSSSAIA
jgi:ParB family chromosome partitioning protein